MSPFCMVTEFLPFGDLFNFLHNNSVNVSVKFQVKVALDIQIHFFRRIFI